ncbi:MAG: zinc ribbon domain-containing protein [Polyangiaceae bacterium]
MTESKQAPTDPAADSFASLDAKLSRAFAFGLPLVTVVAAVVVGALSSVGPAILVLAGGALLGVIAFLWASLRVLSGESSVDGELVAARRIASIEALEDRKRIILRTIKDLEHENAIGKLDEEDYADLVAHYRAEAVTLMRTLDAEVAPVMAKAEAVANAYLARTGIGAATKDAKTAGAKDGERISTTGRESRLPCPKCATSNEPDAAFCKSCGTALGARSGTESGTDNAEGAARDA